MDTTTLETPMSTPGLQIDGDDAMYLRETAGWAKFLAIVGFIFCAIIICIAFFINTIFSSMSNISGAAFPLQGMGIVVTVIYLLIGLLYFFPCYYLFNFSTKMKSALLGQDQVLLRHSLRNLKSCFKFFGIMTIIILCLYGLVLIGVGIGMGIGSFNK